MNKVLFVIAKCIWLCIACVTAFYGVYYLCLKYHTYVIMKNRGDSWAGPPTSMLESPGVLLHCEHWLVGLLISTAVLLFGMFTFRVFKPSSV